MANISTGSGPERGNRGGKRWRVPEKVYPQDTSVLNALKTPKNLNKNTPRKNVSPAGIALLKGLRDIAAKHQLGLPALIINDMLDLYKKGAFDLEACKLLLTIGTVYDVVILNDGGKGRLLSTVDMLATVLIEKGAWDDLKRLVELIKPSKPILNHALAEAAATGNLDVGKFLIRHGAVPWCADDTPLKNASANGHLDFVAYLVNNHGANLKIVNYTPLVVAAGKGDVSNLKSFLDAMHIPKLPHSISCLLPALSKKYKTLNDALVSAAKTGSMECLECLLTSGASPSYLKYASVVVAALHSSLQTVQRLLKETEKQENSLIFRITHPFWRSDKQLALDTAVYSTLTKSLLDQEDYEMIILLLGAGANPNAKVGSNYLVMLARRKDPDNSVAENIAEALLIYGADPNVVVKTENGSLTTPLEEAVCRGNNRIAKLLLAYGADPTLNDEGALKIAVVRDNKKFLEETVKDKSLPLHIRAAALKWLKNTK